MKIYSRRQLIKLGLGMVLYPVVANCSEITNRRVAAKDFSNGGMKGFVLGRVKNRDAAYFEALAGTGARIGRIFFSFTKCRDCDKYGFSYEVRESLKYVLELARVRGIQLVLVGEFPGSERPEFWSNRALRDSFVESWHSFAKDFGSDPVIAGLDLFNEPNPPWPSGKLSDAHAHWQPLAEQAIDAIRQEQVNVPIVYEGVAGGSSMGLRDLVPLKDSNVVYSIHHYSPHDITHQHVDVNWSRTIPYPAGIEWGLGKWDAELGVGEWNRKRMELDLRDTISFQRKYKLPIYVGEFSCVRWAPNNSRERYIADSLAIFNKYGWSWTFHEFRGWPGWDSEIASEDRAATKRSVGAPVMQMLLSELRGKK